MATEILSIDEITVSQADKYLTHNNSLRQLEARLIRVIDRDAGAVPGAPSAGDTYIVDVTTGAWSAATLNDIAHYYNSGWYFYTPIEGLRLWVNDEDKLYIYNGSSWAEFTQGGIQLEDNQSPATASDITKLIFTGDCTVVDNGDNSATVLVTGGTDGVYVEDGASPVSASLFTTLIFGGDCTVSDNGDGSSTIVITGAEGTQGIYLDDNSSPVSAGLFTKLTFTGSCTVTDNGSGEGIVNVTGGGGGSTGIYLEDNNSPISASLMDTLIIEGPGVTVTDNGDSSATVTIDDNTQEIQTKTSDYTLTETDNNTIIELNSGSAINLIIPEDAAENLSVGFSVMVAQIGAGQVTIATTTGSPDSNVTLRSASGETKLSRQYSGATLYKRGDDDWLLTGDLGS